MGRKDVILYCSGKILSILTMDKEGRDPPCSFRDPKPPSQPLPLKGRCRMCSNSGSSQISAWGFRLFGKGPMGSFFVG